MAIDLKMQKHRAPRVLGGGARAPGTPLAPCGDHPAFGFWMISHSSNGTLIGVGRANN
jgi:hypothetical protein